MGLFSKKEEYDRDLDDRLIIYDDDLQTTTIEYVDKVDDGKVTVYGKHAVPVQDCVITNGDVHGIVARVYFYRAPTESIQTTTNLAKLEQSIVLQQITDYSEKKEEKSFDWVKFGLFALLGIAIMFGMSSCGTTTV